MGNAAKRLGQPPPESRDMGRGRAGFQPKKSATKGRKRGSKKRVQRAKKWAKRDQKAGPAGCKGAEGSGIYLKKYLTAAAVCFRKLEPKAWTFGHMSFERGRKDRLVNITRQRKKDAIKREGSPPIGPAGPAPVGAYALSGATPSDVQEFRSRQNLFAGRINEITSMLQQVRPLVPACPACPCPCPLADPGLRARRRCSSSARCSGRWSPSRRGCKATGPARSPPAPSMPPPTRPTP